MTSWLVACGRPQKTASTSDQSASSFLMSGGKFRPDKMRKDLRHLFAGMRIRRESRNLQGRMTGRQSYEIGTGIAGSSNHADLDLAHYPILNLANGHFIKQNGRKISGRFAYVRLAGLALRELEGTTGFGASVLLALDRAAVAGEETTLLQKRSQIRLEGDHRARKTMAHGAGLTRKAAANHRAFDVELRRPIGADERLLQKHAQDGAGKIDFKRLAVDGDPSAAALYPNTRHRILSAAGRIGTALGMSSFGLAGAGAAGAGVKPMAWPRLESVVGSAMMISLSAYSSG